MTYPEPVDVLRDFVRIKEAYDDNLDLATFLDECEGIAFDARGSITDHDFPE